MRGRPVLILLAFIITCQIIPAGMAADSVSGSVSITLQVVNPTPTPTGSGGGGGQGGGGAATGGSSNDFAAYILQPPVLQPASTPVVLPGESAGFPSLGGQAGPRPVRPASPGDLQGGTPPSSLSPLPALSLSILFVFLLFTLAAAYSFLRREVLALYRTWITLYLISMTGLLWAAFISSLGAPLSEPVFIVTCVVGLNLIVHILRFDRVRIPLPVPGRPGG
jgi:hypothetical protein